MFAPEDLGAFQLKTSGNLVGESESQPVLERVSYKTDEVNRNWSGLILILMMISPLVLYDLRRPSTHTGGDHSADLHDLH